MKLFSAWMIVTRRGGSPRACLPDGQLRIYKTKRGAKKAAGKDDVVKVDLHYRRDRWLPK